MNIKTTRRRKAISPVLATVILIAITLIAAIAVAGFVFGLFGSFTSSATVSVSVASCSVSGLKCTLTITNSGTSNTAVNTCTIQNAGVAEAGTFAYGKIGATTQTNIGAGTTQTGATCTVAAVGSAVGSMAVGALSLSNGATAPFSGTWTT